MTKALSYKKVFVISLLLLYTFTVLFYSSEVLLMPKEAKQASLISVFQDA